MMDPERLRLPRLKPDAVRESLVRARCHGVISKRAARGKMFDLAAALALCVYLLAVLGEAVRLSAQF